MSPGTKEIGTKTATSASVVAITANPISCEPSSAANSGLCPNSMRR